MRPCPQCGVECAPDHRFCPACGFPIGALRTAAGDPLIGRTLGGAYVVLENVGSGGMGRVYRAEQTSLGKTVAVKVIHPHLISDESATARFYTEARAASRLNHPNAVSVLDFGRSDDGLLYLVMEFLRGKDLAHVLWEEGPLPAARCVGMLRQVLAALADSHELSIIHRDIKPENILIEPMRTGGDFIKVVDFGLAKVKADVAPSVTVPGIVCGTPDYMAPEQGRGDPLDARSDLYSCGVVLFQTLTGRLPFEADSPTQVVLMHMTDAPPDPRSILPGIPDPIVRVTLKALSKEAADRYQSAVEFADALTAALKEMDAARENVRRTSTVQVPSPLVCRECGAPLVAGVKFCGECGARALSTGATTLPDSRPPRQSVAPGPGTQSEPRSLAFAGRVSELEALAQVRARAGRGQLVTARLVGDVGSGKSRLTRAFLERCRADGDRAFSVGPDVTWAGVAYAPIARCVRMCLNIGLRDDALQWLERAVAARPGSADRVVRAGFEELFTPDGPSHLEGRARREAVVRAMIYALSEAAASANSRALVVAFEQLQHVDTASQAVLTSLTAQATEVPALLLGTHTPRLDPHWLRSEVIPLRGLARAEAVFALQGIFNPTPPEAFAALEAAGDEVLPLYVDQLARWLLEGGGSPPVRLVDLISARFERLPLRARRAVQALALLGEATARTITAVLGEQYDSMTSTSLRLRGWVAVERLGETEQYTLAHELLREVGEASIPAEVRRELDAQCAEALEGHALPLEAQAMFAAFAENPFQPLILFERAGDRAVARGDDLGAALALRRGLDRARRELVRGEIDEPERAVAIFARKLGDALVRAGEASEAEGVLREALEVVPRGNIEWARMQGSLSRALFARGRTPDALRAIDEAIKVARRLNARPVAGELMVIRAELDSELGNVSEAALQLRAADELVRAALAATTPGSSPAGEHALLKLRIEVLLRLARALRFAGETGGAGEPLLEARDLADRHGLIMERARCDAEGGERAEQLGERRAAAAAWRRAAQAANEAGDGLAATTYTERARRLGDVPVQGAGA